MIPEIAAALSSASTAAKMASGLLQLSRDTEINQVVIDLQQSILDLQSNIFDIQSKYEELAESKRKTEAKLVEFEHWDSEAARYELKEIARGIFVYSLKPVSPAHEPIHWLCPNCFQQRQKSILTKPGVDYTN